MKGTKEMKLIDADYLLHDTECGDISLCRIYSFNKDLIFSTVAELVDAVPEKVTCEHCIDWHMFDGIHKVGTCRHWEDTRLLMHHDDFCSKGRKDETD